jgi:hypothetical protein
MRHFFYKFYFLFQVLFFGAPHLATFILFYVNVIQYLNLQSLEHEPSALTTRPCFLAATFCKLDDVVDQENTKGLDSE